MIAVCFVAGTRLTDRAIRAVEEAQDPQTPTPLATHVALLFGDLTIEAVFPRVHAVPTAQVLTPGAPHRIYPLTLPYPAACQAEARSHLGHLYDLRGLLLALGYVLTGRAYRFIQDDRASVHCSELATECLRAGGLSVLPALPPSAITPAALEAALRSGGAQCQQDTP